MRYKGDYDLIKKYGDQGWDVRSIVDRFINPGQTFTSVSYTHLTLPTKA